MMFHTRLIRILVTFPFRQVAPQLFALFPQYPIFRPRLLSGAFLSRQRVKVENDSVDSFSSCIVNTLLLCPWYIHHWNHFFLLYCTTLVHCRLEFVKAVMSLCSFNSHCVTRSYFFFSLGNLFYFPEMKKKQTSPVLQVTFCLPFNKVTLRDTLAMSPCQRRSFDPVDKSNVWEMELLVSRGSSSTSS